MKICQILTYTISNQPSSPTPLDIHLPAKFPIYLLPLSKSISISPALDSTYTYTSYIVHRFQIRIPFETHRYQTANSRHQTLHCLWLYKPSRQSHPLGNYHFTFVSCPEEVVVAQDISNNISITPFQCQSTRQWSK